MVLKVKRKTAEEIKDETVTDQIALFMFLEVVTQEEEEEERRMAEIAQRSTMGGEVVADKDAMMIQAIMEVVQDLVGEVEGTEETQVNHRSLATNKRLEGTVIAVLTANCDLESCQQLVDFVRIKQLEHYMLHHKLFTKYLYRHNLYNVHRYYYTTCYRHSAIIVATVC